MTDPALHSALGSPTTSMTENLHPHKKNDLRPACTPNYQLINCGEKSNDSSAFYSTFTLFMRWPIASCLWTLSLPGLKHFDWGWWDAFLPEHTFSHFILLFLQVSYSCSASSGLMRRIICSSWSNNYYQEHHSNSGLMTVTSSFIPVFPLMLWV